MINTTQLLRDLVSIPSVNPMGRALTGPDYLEHRVTAYLEEFFRGLGVAWERQTTVPLRDNIIARWSQPGARRTVMLEAHQDTVPTDQMTIEPFCARIENGRLYGRGACDIKGGMAAMLHTFARCVREQPAGAANVIMACSVDEEFTFMGVRKLVESGLRADAAIVAEPTQLHIVNAHKGVVRWHLTTSGRSCHSSSPHLGINAIYRMGKLLGGVERFAAHLSATSIDPLLGPATLSVGRIEGGTSVNTVPEQCRVEIDRRVIPGENPLAAPQQLADFLKQQREIDFPFTCVEPWMNKVALSPRGSEDLVRRLGQFINSVVGRHEVQAVPYGTDASSFAEVGVPSVVFGPGDIAKAHTCDEWVPLEEVEKASEILYRFICAGG